MNHSVVPSGRVLGREPAATKEANLYRLHWVTVSVVATLQTLCQPGEAFFFYASVGGRKKNPLINKTVGKEQNYNSKQAAQPQGFRINLPPHTSPSLQLFHLFRHISTQIQPVSPPDGQQLECSYLASLPSTYFTIVNIFFPTLPP